MPSKSTPDKQKKKPLLRWFGKSDRETSAEAPDEASDRQGAERGTEVWIAPKSAQAKRQSLLKERKMTGESLLIGRRGSIGEKHGLSPDDLLISQHEPYTVSKQHCAIEIREDGVWVRDLGSRYGTIVDDRQFGGRSEDAQFELKLEPGVYSLIPGPRGSRYTFTLTVK